MNWLDILLVIVFGLSVLNGILRGFFSLSVGLGATVISILLASWFYGLPAAFISPYVKQQTFANLLGFLVILVAVQIAGFLLVKILVRITKSVGLGWLDRLLGAGFGIVRGLLISIVLVMVLTAFPLNPASTAVSRSYVAPYVMEAARILVYLTPHEIREGFQSNYAKIRKTWKNTIEEALDPPPRPQNF